MHILLFEDFICQFTIRIWGSHAFTLNVWLFSNYNIVWFQGWNILIQLLFFFNKFQSFLNLFFHFLSMILRLLLFYLLHIMFESLFEGFLFCLFLRYKTIYENLWCPKSFFIVIVYIFHIIVFTKILTWCHSWIFLKSNFTKSLISIIRIMRHLRSCLVPWI